jgi:hypothetical protein
MTFHILHSLTCIWYMYTVSAVIDQLLSAGVWFSLHRQVPSKEDSSLLVYGAMSNSNHRLFGAVSVSVFGVQSTLRCIPGGLNSHQYCGRNVRPHIVSIWPRQASQNTYARWECTHSVVYLTTGPLSTLWNVRGSAPSNLYSNAALN